MKAIMKKRGSAIITAVLFLAAICLLLTGTIGGARAALSDSATYNTQMGMKSISLKIEENSEELEDGGALLAALGASESLTVGKKYDEEITVVNDGELDAYVRVAIYRYWTDGKGKAIDLDPGLIELALGEDWVVDEDASTPERTVVYYTKPLEAGETSPAALEGVLVSTDIEKIVTQDTSVDGAYTTIKNIYLYDGFRMGLEVEADGVQSHNAEDAIMSAWGREVSVSDSGELTLG